MLIATAQLEDIQGDIEASLCIINQMMERADRERVNILCLPECFLQGYTLDESETKNRALDLSSQQFYAMLDDLSSYNTALILGLIEKEEKGFYNTAVVIHRGKLLGKYRKVHLFEKNFQPGDSYPVFTVNGLTFGINICYDARFSEGAVALAKQGAQVVFYPLNNKLPTEKAITYRHKHIPNLVARAKEANCWVVSSDVVVHEKEYMGYGCTAIVNPMGSIVERVEELAEGMRICAV